MKEKIKKIILGYLPGFITGLIICGGISVIAATYFPSNDVTYDNSESGLESTDVQGAIDELYGVCFPPKTGSDTITDLVDINTDDLYKDDKGNIRYYGKNPNNYVSFNNELWRIIGVIDGKIKIIRNESIGSKAWASNGYNNWNNSDLKSYLNGEYYNNIENTYRNMISEEIYYLGGSTLDNERSLTASGYYDVERSGKVYSSNNPTSVKQYIGLMYPSDYGYAAGSDCLPTALYNFSSGCADNDYLFTGNSEWLQTPNANSYNKVVEISYGLVVGFGIGTGHDADMLKDVKPVLYLLEETVITGGTGTQNDPYTIN